MNVYSKTIDLMNNIHNKFETTECKFFKQEF